MNSSSIIVATDYVVDFERLGLEDVPRVGGKNASLGEMIRELSSSGVRVPGGFATTASAYWHFLNSTGLDKLIRSLLKDLNTADVASLQKVGLEIRHAILETPIPHDLATAILDAYDHLDSGGDQPPAVAVRSSATAEDLPEASFAGQQESFLNVVGKQPLLDACHRCFASLFTDRAISYRTSRGYDHLAVALSIGIQRMVRSDIGTSGVIFTIDTESGFPDVVLINASYGLGENIVKGTVSPDEYCVFKPTLKTGYRPIIQKTLGTKETKLICLSGGSNRTKNVPVSQKQRDSLKANIDSITAAYPDKVQFFVEQLSQGIAMIAAAFYPRDVIVRMSDFKTNEYSNLIGGAAYEPKEEIGGNCSFNMEGKDMLILTRRTGEEIVLPTLGVTITILKRTPNQVKLGVSTPMETRILRGEIVQRNGNEECEVPDGNSEIVQTAS